MICSKLLTVFALLALAAPWFPFLPSSESCLVNNQVNRGTWKLAACPATNCDDGAACSPKVWYGHGVHYHYCGCGAATDPAHHPICHAFSVWQPPYGTFPGGWAPCCTFSSHANCPDDKPKCKPEPEVAVARCVCQQAPGAGW